MGWLCGWYLQCKNNIKYKLIEMSILCIWVYCMYIHTLNHPIHPTSQKQWSWATSGAGCLWESTQCWRSVRGTEGPSVLFGSVKNWSFFEPNADGLEQIVLMISWEGCFFWCMWMHFLFYFFLALDCWFLFVSDDLQTIFLTCLMKISWNAFTICLDWLRGAVHVDFSNVSVKLIDVTMW